MKALFFAMLFAVAGSTASAAQQMTCFGTQANKGAKAVFQISEDGTYTMQGEEFDSGAKVKDLECSGKHDPSYKPHPQNVNRVRFTTTGNSCPFDYLFLSVDLFTEGKGAGFADFKFECGPDGAICGDSFFCAVQ